MFNVAVLKMRDIIKYFVGTIIIVIIIICTSKYFFFNREKKQKESKLKMQNVQLNSMTGCLEKTFAPIKVINDEYDLIDKKFEDGTAKNYFEEVLKTEISSMKAIEKIDTTKEQIPEINIENQIENEKNIVLADKENSETQVVTQNPISENYNIQYENVKIKNQTTYELNDDMLKPDITIENKNVLIFHTHSCESYTSSEEYPYVPTGNFRTTDLNFTVTRVGTELESYLKQYNLNVIHDTSYHDYPAYNGSYTRSLQTVENILQTTPSDIVIDLHRDAVGSREDYAPTVKIGDDYAAQIMFVIRNK